MELHITKHQTLLRNKGGQAWENNGRLEKEVKRGQAWEKYQEIGPRIRGHRTQDEGDRT